jgi:TonB family protein
MKKLSLLTAFVYLLLTAGAVSAQEKAANFTGVWELDAAKSKLPERMRIESMTLNVAQTDKELKVETLVKRAPRPEAEMPNGGNGGAPPPPMPPDGNRGNGTGAGVRGGRGGMMGGGNGTVTYNLDGKEKTIGTAWLDGSPNSSVSLKAKMENDGKLTLVSTRNVETPNGAMSFKTTETWELLDGGATLKVARETETPRGAQTSEMYFTKKISTDSGMTQAPASSANGTNMATGQGVKQISKGVLNGSAVSLVKPAYPAEARESKASGAVNVQVVIDEQGNVISAKAVSGDTKLRAASEEAARASKFSPTVLSGVAVKVTGVIVYNFVP